MHLRIVMRVGATLAVLMAGVAGQTTALDLPSAQTFVLHAGDPLPLDSGQSDLPFRIFVNDLVMHRLDNTMVDCFRVGNLTGSNPDCYDVLTPICGGDGGLPEIKEAVCTRAYDHYCLIFDEDPRYDLSSTQVKKDPITASVVFGYGQDSADGRLGWGAYKFISTPQPGVQCIF